MTNLFNATIVDINNSLVAEVVARSRDYNTYDESREAGEAVIVEATITTPEDGETSMKQTFEVGKTPTSALELLKHFSKEEYNQNGKDGAEVTSFGAIWLQDGLKEVAAA